MTIIVLITGAWNSIDSKIELADRSEKAIKIYFPCKCQDE